ncbi:type IX secretion system membrane protein PorP/SprF [Pseudopedobacter beijingensis]|uniref:Type IX secretion system membrane protein PorP/SprF n=1 Tax=Pseudopedobacter beijingensis TaxID=1207056 RepID=A0ABW4IEY1_9SPHI
MRTNKLIILAVLLLSIVYKVNAQQAAMYSQYMFNTLAINPAYAGSRNVTSATALYRHQWTGIEGAPKTATFTIDAPLDQKRMGIGFQAYSDKAGIIKNNGVALSYAYRIRMDKGTLAFGMQAGASQYQADFTSVSLSQTSNTIDPAFANNVDKLLFDLGAGLYYNSDKFYVGLAGMGLLKNRFTSYESAGVKFGSREEVHLFLSSGVVLPLNEDFKLKPSILIKGVKGAPIEGDINATLWIKDVIAVGAQYRTSADLAGMLEIQATPQIRIGYSYDYSTTQLRNYNSGSHEIMLRYEFGFNSNKFLSPRYF